MKRVLVIKLTSMGDLMHALPALTDAARAYPGISFDWVVDEAFAEVPSWHPAVANTFKSAHRRWRQQFFRALGDGEFGNFYKQLNAEDYDVVIDAQNNVKSAFISLLRRGKVHGMDRDSVPERPAHLAYASRHAISRQQHAIARQRQLFAAALEYALPGTTPDYGLKKGVFDMAGDMFGNPYIVLVHNASWTTKLWPEAHWHELIGMAGEAGYQVVLPGGSKAELDRAADLARQHDNARALPRKTLTELGGILSRAEGVVSCDTGLAHLAAMTGTPTVTFYGPTSDKLIGTTGRNQVQLAATAPPFACAPCYKRACRFEGSPAAMSSCMRAFTPLQAWEKLGTLLANPV